MRIPQPVGRKGSLKWLQRFVAEQPEALCPAGSGPVEWLSPLAADEFAEYRDAAFLDRIGHAALAPELRDFWPARGPQWDALGRSERGPVLVEAKAHIAEFLSPPTQAGPRSRARIDAAFAMVRADLGVRRGADWDAFFFQYANRLAHLWFLRRHGVDAQLIFVCFLHDAEMGGPATAEAWQAAFRVADHGLGLPARHALTAHIHHLCPDIRLLS